MESKCTDYLPFKWEQDLGRKLGLAKTYTWNAQSYSGFYYDLDSGVSSEEMTIENIGRNIDAGDVKYRTRPTETNLNIVSGGSTRS